MAGPNAGEEEDALPTYKDAFPPLPEKAASPEGTQETANAWTSKIRPLKSSIITQVRLLHTLVLSYISHEAFHTPERTYCTLMCFTVVENHSKEIFITHKNQNSSL